MPKTNAELIRPFFVHDRMPGTVIRGCRPFEAMAEKLAKSVKPSEARDVAFAKLGEAREAVIEAMGGRYPMPEEEKTVPDLVPPKKATKKG